MGKSFQEELTDLINKHSLENGSDTPDFLLAEYLLMCLHAHEKTIKARDKWYSFNPWPGDTTFNPTNELAESDYDKRARLDVGDED